MNSAPKLLKVAILGRPNVGKSTLFNKLTETRKAIVKDEPGVTRDVQSGLVEWCGKRFEIFDTAGVSQGNEKAWSREARDKALSASKGADKIIFVLDGKFGLNPEDHDLSVFVKQLGKPTLVVVNKIDSPQTKEMLLAEFYELGFETFLAASFEHKHGIEEMLDWVVGDQERYVESVDENEIRLAVVGKPNAGKSTLVNQIMGEERVVVSPVAGTTVDSVEASFHKNGQKFTLVDTAGLRRHAKRHEEVELISAFKAEESIGSSHILLMVIDGLLGPTHQDARIVELALTHHKAVILVINKIDVAEKKIKNFNKELREKIERSFHFFTDIPVAFVSAKTGRGVDPLFRQIETIWAKINKKIPTREINDFFFEVIRQAPSPSFHGLDIKFYYITQTRQKPPAFMAFVNDPRGVTNAYRRFIATKIKKNYDLVGIPIRIYAKKRRRGDTSASEVRYGIPDESLR